MVQEHSSKAWVGCVSAAAIIIAAIIGLGVPIAERLADRYFPPLTPTTNSIAPTQVTVVTTLPQPVNQPTTTPNQAQSPVLCYGQCWRYDDNARTMIWDGLADGTEDIWQPSGDALQKIRSGYTAIFTTIVPGEIFACVLSINGEAVKNTCDGVLYQVPPGTYQVTSSGGSAGGFRWCPLGGYGWRVNGGECK